MTSASAKDVRQYDNPLRNYVVTVEELGNKLQRIAAGKRDIAANLSRAAEALRSISSSNRLK